MNGIETYKKSKTIDNDQYFYYNVELIIFYNINQ